jgi:hypothetical protein
MEPNVDVVDETAVAPGFIISERFAGSDGGQIFILDHRGEMVWSYQSKVNNLSRAKMSYDGRFMYAQAVNVAGTDGQIAKISMDGLSEELLSFPAAHHDFAVLPDGALALIRKTDDGCDEIVRSLEGGIETIFRVADAYPEGAELGTEHEACHTNAIHYHPSDDSFTFSDLNNNALVKVSAEGELVWVLGGPHSHFTGDGAEWERQHGHQLLDEKRLLLFVNGPLGSEEPSEVVEVVLNERTMEAKRVWSYNDWYSSDTFGDVQRLPNGNTLVTFSNAGVIQQVDPSGNVVQEFTFPLGGATGYSEFRETLYGPPLR